jgi:hypothetical protein
MRRVLSVSMIVVSAALYLIAITAQAAPTRQEIDQAIERGLAWLAASQDEDDGYWGSGNYRLGDTAAVVLAFENEGHFPGGGTAYSANVEAGLDYIFSKAVETSVPVQPAGDPDTDGDGQAVYFNHYEQSYETGMCVMAIVASNTPDRIVTDGDCAGWTYFEVVQDVVDWWAYAQNETGSGRGGWRYEANSDDSDNSVSQWPVLGMIAAEQWGIYAPEWVKDELDIWVNYIQNPNGGSGYTLPEGGSGVNVNMAKTGALLVEHYWLGDDKDTSTRAQDAINYIDNRWEGTPDGHEGNKGHPYAMFAVYKGLELMEVHTLPSVQPDGDWWGDYAQYLVDTQDSGGYWGRAGGAWDVYDNPLTTGWYIVILQQTIFPVEVVVDVPDCACDDTGYDVNVTYSVERFEASGTLEVYKDGGLAATVELVDFQGSDTYTHNVASDTLGTHTWEAMLEVTAAGTTLRAEDTASLNVYEVPEVGDIPDQSRPFTTFDLDDCLTYSGDPADVIWSATAPSDWTVDIDGDNVVTVTAPQDVSSTATITFTASIITQCPNVICVDSDDAVFVSILPLEVLDVSYDVPNTILRIEFNNRVRPNPMYFDRMGMEVGNSGEWDFALSDARGLRPEQTSPNNVITIDIVRDHVTSVNLAASALMDHHRIDFLVQAGAFTDEYGNENEPVTGADNVEVRMITDGFELGTVGDVNGNGEATAYDAALILQAAVGESADVFPVYGAASKASEFLMAHGYEYDVMMGIADTSKDGDISAYDATLVLQKAAGLTSLAPIFSSSPKRCRLNIDSYGERGLEASVALDDVTHVYSADIVMTYDPQALTLIDVSKTSSLSGWLLEQRADSGGLRISMAGVSQPVENGSLVTISFDAASADAIKRLSIIEFKLNGGMLRTTVENLPKAFALLQNYPNPFNPETWIPYQLSEAAEVTITIYNVSGQMVRQLALGSKMPGYYTDKSRAAYWDGTSKSGEKVSSGVYFYQLQAGRDISVRKMIMAK